MLAGLRLGLGLLSQEAALVSKRAASVGPRLAPVVARRLAPCGAGPQQATLQRSSSSCAETQEERESMPYDVCIVGAGPAGLAAAIRIKQLKEDVSVCVLEKGAEVGAHSMSGNVFDPRALDELLPEWRSMEGVPIRQEVTEDYAYFLTEGGGAWSLPVPPTMRNEGKSYVISLSALTRFLGSYAEDVLGVDVFPGFSASEVLYGSVAQEEQQHVVRGVATADMGISKSGEAKDTYARGIELRARCVLLGEGCRGSLSESIKAKLGLQEKAGADAQTYGLGIKEVWQVQEDKHNPGEVRRWR